MSNWAHLIVPTLILLGALITDLRSRKIYNWYVLGSLALAVVNTLAFFGVSGLAPAAAAAGVALMISLPLVLIGVLGGGDMKLFVAFGFATSYSAVLNVVVASFIWAAVFGIIYSLVNGSFKRLVTNMGSLSTGGKASDLSLHKIPFTLPIFIGWMTYLIKVKGGL